MASELPESLREFFDTLRARYGNRLWYKQTTGVDGTPSLVVMLERIAVQARICAPGVRTVSFERDESVGSFYQIVADGTLLHTHPSRQEYETVFEKQAPEGRIAWSNELMAGELVRVFEVPDIGTCMAAVVYHEFSQNIPFAIGWLDTAVELRPVTGKTFLRPEQMQDFMAACRELESLPYRTGGKTKQNGFDCSGLTQRIMWRTRGVWLPRKAAWQALVSEPVKSGDIKQGDLVFFNKTVSENKVIDHIAIVTEPHENLLPTVFHAKKIIGKVVFEDLNGAAWLNSGEWGITGYGRIGTHSL